MRSSNKLRCDVNVSILFHVDGEIFAEPVIITGILFGFSNEECLMNM